MGFQCHAHPAQLTNEIEEASAIKVHPAKLTCQIKEAATIETLLCMHRAHEMNLNHIHFSAC